MIQIHRGLIALTPLFIAAICLVAPASAQSQAQGVLKGKIHENGVIKPDKGQSPGRNNWKDKEDPFDDDDQNELEIQKNDAFNGATNSAANGAAPKFEKPHNLKVKEGGSPPQPSVNDPDSSKEMTVAWDIWHKRVAEAVFMKVQMLAGSTLSNSPPLLAQVIYTVSRDGRIDNIRILQSSQDLMYDTVIQTAIKSMQGSPLVQFPQGSKRTTVEKMSTFSHNFGGPAGYKYLMNDQERLQNGRKP